MSADILTLTDGNFESELANSELPMLVDFWASWCGPCMMLAPVLEELAKELKGRVRVGKLNVDENRETAASFGVMSIPTLILFKNGKEVARITGFRPKEELDKWIAQVL